MRYYVYALIDPTRNNTPFYLGKGLDNRLQSHFKEAQKLSSKEDIEVVGCDTHSLLDDATADRASERLTRIAELAKLGYNHTDLARIVARRLDEPTSIAVEAFLIRGVYGLANLTNCVEGVHAHRFRPYGECGWIGGFDVDVDISDAELRELEERYGRYYAYTLRTPDTGRVFYVGKGTGRRIFEHFTDAVKTGDAASLEGHLRLLQQLIQEGHTTRDICRVEARVEHEQQAFAIEALLMKFVHGFTTLDNRVAGHHGEMFRAKGNWAPLRGFDLPYVCDPGKAVDRADKRDGMMGEGLAVPLLALAAGFPNLQFDPPKVLDSSELGIEADLVPRPGEAGVRVKVFIRRRKIQVELRPRRKAQREWVRSHFTRLGAYPLRRADDVFFPDAWRGPANMTDDLNVIAHRVRVMQEIVSAQDANSLSPEARSLLPGQ